MHEVSHDDSTHSEQQQAKANAVAMQLRVRALHKHTGKLAQNSLPLAKATTFKSTTYLPPKHPARS